MMGRSHLVTGVAAWTAVQALTGPPRLAPLALGGLVAGVGVLLPDIDCKGFGRRLFLGHRKLTHTGLALTVLIVAGTIAWAYRVPVWIPAALVTGYATHLAGDACTRSGIPFLYLPGIFAFLGENDQSDDWPWQPVWLLPEPMRISTGGRRRSHPAWWQARRGLPVGEWIVMAVFVAIAGELAWLRWF